MTFGRRAWIVALALGAGWLAAAQVGKVPPAIPALVDDLSLDMVQAGWVASAITSVTAVLGIAGGLLVVVVGSGPGLLIGLGMLGLGSLAGFLADTAAMLIASRLLEGLGFVLVVVTAPSLLAMELGSDPLRRRRLLIIWGTYMPVGIALMMATAPLLLSLGGWRGLWGWNAALIGVVLAVGVTRHRQLFAISRVSALNLTELKEGVALPGPWLMGICFGCYTVSWFVLVTWLPSFAMSEMGYSLYSAAWLTATAVVLNIGGNLSAQVFAAFGVPRWAILAGVQLLIGSLGWMVFSSGLSPLLRSITAVIACGAAGALPATVFAAIPIHARRPAQVVVGNGIVMQCSSIGSFAGPPAMAVLVTAFNGWDAGRWLIPAVATIGICSALALRTVERKSIRRQSMAL